MSNKTVNVRVVCLVDESELDEEDQELPEEVEVVVEDTVPTDQIAKAALDAFHESFAVEVLDDFEFQVWSDGEEIFENETEDNPVNYALTVQAWVV